LPTRARSPQQHMPITVGPFCLTHPVNFPCGRKLEYPEETHDFRQSVDFLLFHTRTGFESHWESSHWDLNLRPQRWKASALTTWPPKPLYVDNMHQGLDPKALPLGHSKGDSSSPSLPHSHSLCQVFSPWVAAHSSTTFLSWKQPITVIFTIKYLIVFGLPYKYIINYYKFMSITLFSKCKNEVCFVLYTQ
jgi:hypothetical protein